jgi:glycosyltransferase involved in cell wall biosynthesis
MGRADEAFAERVNQLSHLDPDHVRFCGYVPDDDVQALLATAGVVALPYTNTTQSGVAAMALTAGACVVASDLPGLRFGLGDAALFVPVGDPRALGAAIDEVLGNPTLSEQLRERAKALSAKDSYDKVAESILDLGA